MLAYEELKGSSGRQMFFRPRRFEATHLFFGTPPKVTINANSFRLGNISLTGLSASANQSVELDFGEGDLVPITIAQAGIEIFAGKARVVRCERHVFGSRVALNLIDGTVDFNSLLRRNAHARISQQLAILEPDTKGLVSPEYRAHCADVLRFLRAYRAVTDASMQPQAGRNPSLSIDDMFELCEERIIPQWRKLWLGGNDLVRGLMSDKPTLDAVKEFTELVLTPEFNQGPVWWRSYFKPAGYPGDFEIMNYVYDWQREGKDIYGQLLHRIGLDVSECITTRMHVVRKTINTIVHQHQGEQPARILSLGCGSAREVQLHLDDASSTDQPVVFTLIDQEENALAYAYDSAYPLTLTRKKQAKIQALNVSFTDVLRGGKWLDDVGGQDLIYSVGLIDYLVDKRARALAERLYDRLLPGGLLIIGNMNETELSNLWPMEFITDWHLYYRTEAEMLAWTSTLPGSRAWTETEPTGRVRLLFVRKPV